MEIIGDGGERMKGFWTGQVKTKVNNSYLTVPVLAAWRVSPRWKLNAGPYVSYRMEGNFTGDVYDGYLRELDPTGNKVVFEDGKSAPYDFSKDLRRFAWGATAGRRMESLQTFECVCRPDLGYERYIQERF